MLIYFFSYQPNLCKRITNKLEDANYQCAIFNNINFFYNLLETNGKLPGLFVIDYSMIQHDVLNVFNYILRKHKYVPLIFYNDPFPTSTTRANYWLYQCSTHFSDLDLTELKPIFIIIANAVDSAELKPYIPLIQRLPDMTNLDYEEDIVEKPAVEHIEFEKDFNIYAFRRETNMMPTIFHLLEYLYEKKGEYVSVEELRKVLLLNGKIASPSTVAAYISRLRSYFLSKPDANVDIIFAHKSYKLIIF